MKNPRLILLLLVAVLPCMVQAQELPRPSMSKEVQQHTLPSEYNMKAGPILFNLTSSVEGDYIDNVGLTRNNTISDFTLTPEVGLTASWPITHTNTLSLTTSLGYTRYLFHPKYDSSDIMVAPNSRLAFDVFIGNAKIDFHDDFSYQQDPVSEAALSNLVNFDRFKNVAGIGVLWDMNKVILNANYDHINFISTGLKSTTGANLSNYNLLDYSADQISGEAEVHMSTTLVGGVEGAASRRTYDHYSGNYDTWTAGPFVRIEVSQHVAVQVSGGYENINSPINFNGPALNLPNNTIQPTSSRGSDDSYYANLTIDHQLSKYYMERLSLGHDINLGILGDQSDSTYANYTGSWKVNTKLNLALNLSYQDINEVGGLVNVSSYNLLNAGLQANFPVTKHISGSAFYQFTDKLASMGDQGYEQNKLGFILTYEF